MVVCQTWISESLTQRLSYVSVANLCISSRLSTPNELPCAGAGTPAITTGPGPGPGSAATGNSWRFSDRAAGGAFDFEPDGVILVVARWEAATLKYVHFSSRVVQFEHGGPRSSHLTRLFLH